nr:MAG TPA: hypothetical protein [Caudoviricetes sp.]
MREFRRRHSLLLKVVRKHLSVLHPTPLLESNYLHVQSIARCKTFYNTIRRTKFCTRMKGEV